MTLLPAVYERVANEVLRRKISKLPDAAISASWTASAGNLDSTDNGSHMAKLLSRHFSYQGNRHYTKTSYRWYDDGTVVIEEASGNDDWDSHSCTECTVREVQFDGLHQSIKQELLAKQSAGS